MIKNIIFDLGNVLIHYTPDRFLRREGVTDPDDHALMMKEIFKSEEWILADAGDISIEDIEKRCCARVPERLHKVAHKLITNWYDPIEPIDGMAEFMKKRKDEGMGLYVLTNAPSNVHIYFPNVPGHELVDGLVVSADVRLTKPYPDVFNYVLKTFNLKADECLFVDDLKVNTDGAEAVGIHGYTFDGDTKKLEDYITEFNKKS